MAALIDWSTVGQIFAESVAAGVVIVGAFALGARLISGETARDGGGSGGDLRRSPVGYLLAAACFLVALAAVAYGVYFTIDK